MSILLLPGFSDEQREALRLDRHIVVRAAAGSGKTFVLVERYVRMLSRGVHPRAIVAITFTRKAAAEMLSRIRERIEQLLQSPQLLTPEECAHLQRARKNISSARVSTIHSFCSGILREYAVEAGLSPDFSELNSADRYGMYAEAIDAVVQAWWNSPAHHDHVRNLFFELGSGMAMKFLGSITRDSHKLEQLRALYQRPDDELPGIVSRMYHESLFEEHLSMVQQLQYAIDGSAADPLKPEVAEWLSELAESAAKFLSLHNEDCTHNFAHKALSILVALPQPSFTAVALKSNKAAKQAFEIYKSIVKSVDGISADPYKADIRMIAHARTLTRMAVDVAAEADRRKKEAGALDFDDLQRYTLQLLENDAVRRAVCRGIEYIMMDEFQDTDDVQYTLLKKLVPELDGSADRSSINVFLVGDVKQSIYGFRNADVRVFARAEQDVLALNSRVYNEPGVGSVHLPASYRMAPQVAAVVNSVCTQAFGTHQSEYDVPYEPLVCARDTNTLAPGRFEFVLGTNFSSKARAEGNKNIEQSALVADAISHVLKSGVQVYDKSSSSFRQASYRDIAVLCRSAKPLEQLETELLRAQIPFIRHAGRGFYSTQEVRDAISFLTFLVDHSNNQALIALLRSPMFAVSDDTIYAYQTSAGGYSLWEHLLHCRHSAVTHISDARLSKAVDLLLTFGREALMRPASESLREILLQTGWDAAVGYQEHRTDQSRRNMDKLGTVLRDIEQSGFRHTADVIHELEYRAGRDDDEPEAAVLSDDNVVNLMTIHASKGLEFPVVVMYNIDYKGYSGHSSLNIHDELGLCFSLADKMTDCQTGSMAAMSRRIQEQKEAAELKRLMYVAMTRAKDHFLLSCSMSVSEKGDAKLSSYGMMELFAPVLPSVLIHGHTYSCSAMVDCRDQSSGTTPQPVSSEFSVRAERDTRGYGAAESNTSNDLNAGVTVAADARAAAYVDLALVPVEPGTEIFSATQLMTYHRSPLEYFKRYRLGITDFNDVDETDNAPGGDVAVGDDDAQSTRELRDSASVTAADIGTIVHEVVAAIGLWWDVSDEQNSEKNSEQNLEEYSKPSAEHPQTLQAVIQKACSALNIRADGELYARIDNDCRHVAEYMRARSITPGQLIHQEYSLTMPVQQDFITGTIDAIVDCGNGVVEVWDWKTNAMEGTSPQELLRRYDVQLRLYCLLLSKSMPHTASITARLVFTRTGQEAVLTMDATAIADFEKELAVMINEIKRM